MWATADDVSALFRTLSNQERERAEALIPVVEATLKQEARNAGRNLFLMVENEQIEPEVIKSVVVDVVARCLMTSTNQEPMTQMSQSALGYTVSGTFLSPGGGLFIKKSELARLGLKKQRIGVIELGHDTRHHCGAGCEGADWR